MAPAAALVAQAILFASVDVLLETIVSGQFLDIFRSTKLDLDLLEKLKITLLTLQAVRNDAEEKQITKPAVKEWLAKLQDAVFEVEDLFDEINTKALRCRVRAEQKGKMAKVQTFLSSHFKRCYKAINSKMQALLTRLDEFAKKGHLLELKEGDSHGVWFGTPTSSVAEDKSDIFGKDRDREKLKEFLLSKDAGEGGSKIGVISIVGMGGLGKTTLARLLYNDPEVKGKFDLKAWAHISKNFDVLKLTKALLESVRSKSTDADNLDTLQVQLQQSLSGKMFLLVIDDVWDVSYVDWNRLKGIFSVGEKGSRIIITTRNERDAITMQTFLSIHKLEPLESEDCWSLLAKHAFGASNYQQCSNLEEIGREIAQKCDGLPLAAVALGGLLRTNLSPRHWNHVLKSNIWELEYAEVKSTLLPTLLLSYNCLSAPLKRCFAYCAIFPKKSMLVKEMVVQLWIAEGLVPQHKSEKSWENVGEEYFDELVSRSLIHRRFVDGNEIFEMHELMNDLATIVSSPYCIRFDEQKAQESLESVRHLSCNRNAYDSYNKFDRLHESKCLRTFLSLPLQESRLSDYRMSDKALRDLLPTMKHLHLLSLSQCKKIPKVPTFVGNLIYLRYLNLSGTDIVSLPSETCKLFNLQTLLVSNCSSLTELPEDMGKLVNLRNLDISGTPLRKMPVQIGKLKNLQTLSNFIASKQRDGLKVAALEKFPHLRGKLSISKLQNVIDRSDASQANLEAKKQIDELVLEWHHPAPSDSNSKTQVVVLEQFRPSVNLKSLTIDGYGGTNFPKWLSDFSFVNMVHLKIWNCDNCSWLPPIGCLGKLKELSIRRVKSLKSVGAEFYGSGPSFQPFPSLETLSFEDMPEWEEWNFVGGTTTEFPTLRCLSLEKCLKLKGIVPTNLPFLTKLKLRECPLLVESGTSHDNSNTVIVRPSSQLVLPPLNSLCKLTLYRLSSLTSLPRDGLPKTLLSLGISDCENMKFPAHESLHNYTSLEYLKIDNSCCSLTSFTLGSLPVLKSLIIRACKNLKSVLIAEDALHQQSLSFLRDITIGDCNELESFSFGGLGLPIPNLNHFHVFSCEKLHSLPEPMNTLVELQDMQIYNLPNLQYIAKDGFPINLRQLEIGSIGGALWNTIAWEYLTCLSKLQITSGDIVKELMKMEAPLLLASLVTLRISNLADIKCLDGKWLRHLTSLQKLEIYNAPNLKSLPEEEFPSSLSELRISQCPLLEARLWWKRGKEWCKIAHIPSKEINGKIIT